MDFVKILFGVLLILLLARVASCIEPGAGSIENILRDSWLHYREVKIEKDTGRPLADPDNFDVANGSKGQYLTFSESVSYVLYRAVLIDDRETFDRTWGWAAENLQRKNIDQVFDWQGKRWIPVPPEKKDNLFAWRYTPNINGSGRGGIIYYYWTPENNGKLWRDGLDVAPDGDELIAGALVLAHTRWGSAKKINYRQEALNIIRDLWDKTVNKFRPGEILFSRKCLSEWFKYKSEQGEMLLVGNDQGIKINTKDTLYAGIGKMLSDCDLSDHGLLKVFIRGNGFFKITLEDDKKQKLSSFNNALKSPEKYQEFIIQFDRPIQNFDLRKVRIVMIEFSNGYFELQKIFLNQNKIVQKPRYHLFSNDKHQPWINVSYYMPFLYRIFAKLDQEHPWQELASAAYEDMKDSAYASLKNDKSEVFKGVGKLMPNWLTFNELGEIVDLPWAVDGFIDDYMSGWDAFRTWYFMAVDKYWHQAVEPDYFLAGDSYKFFRDQLNIDGRLYVGYTISGEKRNINWVGQSTAGSNGAYLAFFKAANDQDSVKKILAQLIDTYNQEGYWESKHEYYKQNWAWLGLAFYTGLGKELFAEINSQKTI